jgi:hypothetical protein
VRIREDYARVRGGYIGALVEDGEVNVHVSEPHGFAVLPLSVEEAIQFSRMIVKAAAEAAGLETASEALSGADPTGDTGTP